MRINCNQFYFEVMMGDKPINQVFNELPRSAKSNDYDLLFNEFISELDSDFNYFYKNDNEQYKTELFSAMPEKKAKRVRLTMIILSLLAMGASFNEDVFLNSMDYVVKRELLKATLNLN